MSASGAPCIRRSAMAFLLVARPDLSRWSKTIPSSTTASPKCRAGRTPPVDRRVRRRASPRSRRAAWVWQPEISSKRTDWSAAMRSTESTRLLIGNELSPDRRMPRHRLHLFATACYVRTRSSSNVWSSCCTPCRLTSPIINSHTCGSGCAAFSLSN